MPARHRVLAALVGLAILVACNDPPTGPSPPPPPPPTPPPATSATALRIEGPASVAPGTAAQYRLIASFADGTTRDVASQAVWTTTNASVMTVSSTGMVTGVSRGEASLSAHYSNREHHVYVFVLEEGTYRVNGQVTESGGGLPGARVEVVAGTGRGLTGTTGTSGSYALYGLAGEVQIEVVLDGFERERRTIVVNEHARVDLVLRPSVTPTDLNGDWRLTLSASSGCAPAAPGDTAVRSYAVTIAQTGTNVQVTLLEPSLTTAGTRLGGFVVDRNVTVLLPSDDFYYFFYGLRYYALVESLPGRLLAIAGTARGERTGSAVTGTLDGEIALYGGGGDGGYVRNLQFACRASDHGFRLDRN